MSIDSENNYSCTGFHGTNSESANSILSSNTFLDSQDEEEWLGTGVYFFEDDVQQAVNYIYKAKRVVNFKIIQADINTNKLLNLVDTKTYEQFESFAKKFQNRYKTRKDYSKRKLINAVILDAMYKLEPYEVVRAVFPVPKTKYAPRTNIQPVQIQVCVRKHDCISNIKEVEV